MKLHLGCGEKILEGYTNIDLYNPKAEVKADIAKLPYDENSADEIYNCHVIEHSDYFEAMEWIKEWKRVLKPGGSLVMETPDLTLLCQKYMASSVNDRVKLYPTFFAKAWLPGEVHKFLYSKEQMVWTLYTLGFEDVQFHYPDGYPGIEDVCMKVSCRKPIVNKEIPNAEC
jgi:predicted SAM-dependent methyltransferase